MNKMQPQPLLSYAPRFYPNAPIRGGGGKPYLGISMGSVRLYGFEHIAPALRWTMTYYDQFGILIGDHIDRLNFVIFDGETEERAIIQSTIESDLLTNKINSFLNDHGCRGADLMRVRDFVEFDNFHKEVDRLTKLLRNHELFRAMTLEIIKSYLVRRKQTTIPNDQALMLCERYLVEEWAVFEILAGQGYLTQIYAGKHLSVLKEIVLGNLPNVSPMLERLTLVELRSQRK